MNQIESLFQNTQSFQEVFSFFQESRACIEPEVIEEIFNKGCDLYQRGSFEEAKHSFSLAARLNPQSKKFWMSFAGTFVQLKEYGKAIPCYMMVMLLDPSDPTAHFLSAYCYAKEKKIDEALDFLQLSMKLSQEDKKYESVSFQAKGLWQHLQDCKK